MMASGYALALDHVILILMSQLALVHSFAEPEHVNLINMFFI